MPPTPPSTPPPPFTLLFLFIVLKVISESSESSESEKWTYSMVDAEAPFELLELVEGGEAAMTDVGGVGDVVEEAEDDADSGRM
jgi:hypothetical protein